MEIEAIQSGQPDGLLKSEPKKRGPKKGLIPLEKRLLKQRLKDKRDVKKLLLNPLPIHAKYLVMNE
jgi:hypothetical protein